MRAPHFLARSLQYAVLTAFVLALTLHVEGCTIIGVTMGAITDSRASHGGAEKVLEVKAGRPVSLQLWDGSTIDGKFAGCTRDSAAGSDSGHVSPLRHLHVRIDRKSGPVSVPAEDIAKVTAPQNTGVVTGFLMGLAMDAMVIHGMSESNQHQQCGGDFNPSWYPMARPAPERGPVRTARR